MSLIRCNECGSTISNQAAFCPQCGYRPDNLNRRVTRPAPAPVQSYSGMAIASLVLGITSIPTIATIIGPICAIIGFVLGICGSRAKDKKHGCATAGIVLSAVTLAIWLVIVLVLIFAASYTAGQTL